MSFNIITSTNNDIGRLLLVRGKSDSHPSPPASLSSRRRDDHSNDDTPSDHDALPTPCEDSSYFDGEWVSRTVHEAMSHCSFFVAQDDANDAPAAPFDPRDNPTTTSHAPRHARASSPPFHRSRSLSPTSFFPSASSLSAYRPHFSPRDFSSATWTAALERCRPSFSNALGAAVLTAAMVVSPLGWWGAAAAASAATTTVWAVGRWQGEGGQKGGCYQIWGGEEFVRLFWMDPPLALEKGGGVGNRGGDRDGNDEGDREEDAANMARGSEDISRDSIVTVTTVTTPGHDDAVEVMRHETAGGDTPKEPTALLGDRRNEPRSSSRLRRIRSAPVPTATSPNPRRPPDAIPLPPSSPIPSDRADATAPALLRRHYPPLQTRVVRGVEFPGLRPDDFFRVFFADDAPYSMREFQKKNGDVDVVYGKWEGVDWKSLGGRCSFKAGARRTEPPSLPPLSVRERTLSFHTLTKSYFGPAYAKATKVQRAVQLSDHLLVIENETSLADIPYADRFRVVERWIVEAVRMEGPDKKQTPRDTARYTTTLAVDAEVVMLKHCSFESQIRKKASQTFTEMVTEWCKTAKAALQATEEQKRQRRKPSFDDEDEDREAIEEDQAPSSTSSSTPSGRESIIFEQHRQNLEELDKWIRNGDSLEWSGVEVTISSEAGTRSEWAPVLVFPHGEDRAAVGNPADVVASAADSVEVSVAVKGMKTVEPRKGIMTRKFLRRISSKVPRSREKILDDVL